MFVKLLNDAFDVMNGRWFSKAIHPGTWEKQRQVYFCCQSMSKVFNSYVLYYIDARNFLRRTL